jgi:pimeloyl-ACP methyl ester carboxylesterase
MFATEMLGEISGKMIMPPHFQSPNSKSIMIEHSNGQTTHLIEDDYTDPWVKPETILIQAGFARHAAFWYHWVPSLARRFRVIRRDTRGHGKSSAPDQSSGYEYTLDTILQEIVDTLDQLGLKRVHFLGESTSGMLGEALAAKYSERLHSLIICSSPTYLPPAALRLFSFGHPSWPDACRTLGSRGWAEELSKVPGTLSTSEPHYKDWWLEQIEISSGEGLGGYAEFLSTLDARPFLSQISVPTLVLAPAHSAATTVDDQREISRQISASKLVVIEGLGHEIYVDKAEDCQHALLAFLDELPRV